MRGDVGPADPATNLVELGETEQLGTFDDQCVRLGNVQARFDDRRRDEHVGVTAEKAHHPLLEVTLGHLAVGHEHTQPRNSSSSFSAASSIVSTRLWR